MDPRYAFIRHLYGETRRPSRTSSEETPSETEQQALQEVKFVLDHRTRARPDAATLDAIMQVASQKHTLGVRRPDRRPLARSARSRSLLLGALCTFLLLCATTVLWWTPESQTSQADTASAEEVAPSMQRGVLPDAVTRPAPDPLYPATNTTRSASPADLAWDPRPGLVDVHKDLETLQAFRLNAQQPTPTVLRHGGSMPALHATGARSRIHTP